MRDVSLISLPQCLHFMYPCDLNFERKQENQEKHHDKKCNCALHKYEYLKAKIVQVTITTTHPSVFCRLLNSVVHYFRGRSSVECSVTLAGCLTGSKGGSLRSLFVTVEVSACPGKPSRWSIFIKNLG